MTHLETRHRGHGGRGLRFAHHLDDRRGLFKSPLGLALALCLGLANLSQPLQAARAAEPDPASVASDASGASSASGAATPQAFRHMIPAEELETSADTQYRRLLDAAARDQRLLDKDAAQVKRVRAILQKLVPYAIKWNDRARHWRWEVNVVRSPEIDAIGLPGGKLWINSGMIDRLSLRDDEIAYLLAHLSAHALREHARGRLNQSPDSKLEAERMTRLFGVTPGAGITGTLGAQLLTLHYGAADETEADVIGADIASRAGFDPRAGINFWQKVALANRRHPLEFASVHPFTSKREAAMQKRLHDMLPLFAKARGYSLRTLPSFPAPPGGRR